MFTIKQTSNANRLQMVIVAVLLVVLASCNSGSTYKLETGPTGLKFHFFSSDPGGKTGNVGDVYDVNARILTESDSVVVNRNLLFKRSKPIYAGDLHEALSLLHRGDSAVFALNADSFFYHHGIPKPSNIADGEDVRLFIRCNEIMNPIEHIIFMSEKELLKIDDFLDRKGWEMNKDTTGIRWERLQASAPAGDEIEVGDTVEISYLYYTLEEKIIQQSKPNDYWKFEVGDPLRIPGMSRVLTLMRNGEKVRAILPFTEAFGEKGFPPLIQPYETIVIEIEVHNLIKP